LAAAFTAILILNTERKQIKQISIVVLTLLMIAGVLSNRIDALFSSFSVTSDMGGSTLTRLMAMQYFKTFTDANPLLGMGIVRPYTPELTYIATGPNGVAYFDELGLLGGFFRLGILGMFVIVFPLVRMMYCCFRIYKYKAPLNSLFVGIMVYILISQVSLNYLDFQRAVIASFYWAILEFYYRMKKDELENENNNYTCSLE
jgi:hypothetical protein